MTNHTPATAPITQALYQVVSLRGDVLIDNLHTEKEAQIAALQERADSGRPVTVKRIR